LAGSGHREDPFGETFSCIGLVPEAEFSPLDGGANGLFGSIVGGFHSLMSEKREQVIPVGKSSSGSSGYFTIRAAPVLEAVTFHSCPHESRGIQELWPGDVALTESVPTTKDVPDFLEHIFGKHIGLRAASALLEPLELSDHVCPAKLPDPFLVVTAVGGMIIRGDHPFEDAAQNGSEDFGSTACGYGEINDEG
jgi:hypothetical protein